MMAKNIYAVCAAVLLSTACSQLDDARFEPASAPPIPKPTAEITASPDTIRAGEEVTLTVSSEYGDVGLILPIGISLLEGQIVVKPERTTTYVFSVNGEGGTAHASVIVPVLPDEAPPAPIPTASIAADPAKVSIGESVTLTVSSTDADEGFLSVGVFTLGGQFVVTPTQTTTYYFSVRGPGGSVNSAATVEVEDGGNAAPKPTAAIAASATKIQLGDEVTLTLASTDATEALLVPTGAILLEGTVTDSPQLTTSYLYIVNGPGGSAFATVTVEVEQPDIPGPPPPAAPTAAIDADPKEIASPGQPVTLTVASTDAVHGLLSPPGTLILNGDVTVNPEATTTYFFSVLGPGGEALASTTVQVGEEAPPEPTATIVASPTKIKKWHYSRLTVTSTNGLTGRIEPIGVEILNGSIYVRPRHTTEYTFIVDGEGGRATASTTVKVVSHWKGDDDS